MERSWQEAKKKGLTPKGLVLISPSNPTGKVMEKKNLNQIL
jgi:aspartate/methionine/tyrosine aminotransferase